MNVFKIIGNFALTVGLVIGYVKLEGIINGPSAAINEPSVQQENKFVPAAGTELQSLDKRGEPGADYEYPLKYRYKNLPRFRMTPHSGMGGGQLDFTTTTALKEL